MPTRTVFVPPGVTREEKDEFAWLSPEIETDEAIGEETEDRNSQIPATLGFGLT